MKDAYSKLTPQQRKFVDEFLVTGSPAKAIRAAEYCPAGKKIMSKEKTSYQKLTRKQRAFVDFYLATDSSFEAVKKAGYIPNGNEMTLRKHGNDLLRTESVRTAIDEILAKEDLERRLILRRQENRLEQIASDKKKPDNVRLKASEMIIRMNGGFVDRTEISGPEGGTLTFNIIRPEKDESENVQLEDDAETV